MDGCTAGASRVFTSSNAKTISMVLAAQFRKDRAKTCQLATQEFAREHKILTQKIEPFKNPLIVRKQCRVAIEADLIAGFAGARHKRPDRRRNRGTGNRSRDNGQIVARRSAMASASGPTKYSGNSVVRQPANVISALVKASASVGSSSDLAATRCVNVSRAPDSTSLPTDTPRACNGAGEEKYSAATRSKGQMTISPQSR